MYNLITKEDLYLNKEEFLNLKNIIKYEINPSLEPQDRIWYFDSSLYNCMDLLNKVYLYFTDKNIKDDWVILNIPKEQWDSFKMAVFVPNDKEHRKFALKDFQTRSKDEFIQIDSFKLKEEFCASDDIYRNNVSDDALLKMTNNQIEINLQNYKGDASKLLERLENLLSYQAYSKYYSYSKNNYKSQNSTYNYNTYKNNNYYKKGSYNTMTKNMNPSYAFGKSYKDNKYKKYEDGTDDNVYKRRKR